MNELLWFLCSQNLGTNEERKQLRQEVSHTLKIIHEIRAAMDMKFVFRIPFGDCSVLSKRRGENDVGKTEMEELWNTGYFAERVSQTLDFLELNFPTAMEGMDRSHGATMKPEEMAHNLLMKRGTYVTPRIPAQTWVYAGALDGECGSGAMKKQLSKVVTWAKGTKGPEVGAEKDHSGYNMPGGKRCTSDPILRGVGAGLEEIASIQPPCASLPIPIPTCSILGHQGHMIADCPLRVEMQPRSKEIPTYYRQFGVPAHTIVPIGSEIAALRKEAELQALQQQTKGVTPAQNSSKTKMKQDEAGQSLRSHRRKHSCSSGVGELENFYEEIEDGGSTTSTSTQFPNRTYDQPYERGTRGRDLDLWKYQGRDRRKLAKMDLEKKHKKRESAPRRQYYEAKKTGWGSGVTENYGRVRPWIQYPQGDRGRVRSDLQGITTRRIPASNYAPFYWNRPTPNVSIKEPYEWNREMRRWETVTQAQENNADRQESHPQEHFSTGVKMGRQAFAQPPNEETKEKTAMEVEFMDWERAISDLGSSVENMAQKMSNVHLNLDKDKGDRGSEQHYETGMARR